MNIILVRDLEYGEEFKMIATHACGRVVKLQAASKSIIALLVYPDGRMYSTDLHANVRVIVPYYCSNPMRRR